MEHDQIFWSGAEGGKTAPLKKPTVAGGKHHHDGAVGDRELEFMFFVGGVWVPPPQIHGREE